jgi:hypothetical protein
MKHAYLLAITVLAISPTAVAQHNGPVVLGFGSVTAGCSTWVRADRDTDLLFASWVLGYLSAVNVATSGNITGAKENGGMPNSAVLDWVKNWCRSHPMSDVSEAQLCSNWQQIHQGHRLSREGLKT